MYVYEHHQPHVRSALTGPTVFSLHCQYSTSINRNAAHSTVVMNFITNGD